jgi:hypothetical protein
MAVEKLAGKTKIVASKIVGSARDTTIPSNCRDPFPNHEGSGSVRRSGRRQTDNRQFGGDFFRGEPIFLVAEEEVFVL